MEILDGIILGVVQGVTEFLPISSSGHLILAREVLNLQVPSGLAVDAVLQLATSLAILIYFRKIWANLFKSAIALFAGKAIREADRILLGALILGTIPAAIVGLFLEDTMETLFRSSELVAYALIVGSLIFWAAEKLQKANTTISYKKGLIIGLFQTLALIPGMSRSGMTISGGLFLGLTREEAARFGFLLSFPILFGSGVKKLAELIGSGYTDEFGLSLLLSSAAAFFVGLAVIHWLLGYLKNHSLAVFIWYRLALALVVLAVVNF